jgi:hypothetical protein
LLYDDNEHESLIESIIDQSLTAASLSQAITELKNVAKCAGKSSSHLLWLNCDFEALSTIDVANNVQQENLVLLQIDDTLYTNWYN